MEGYSLLPCCDVTARIFALKMPQHCFLVCTLGLHQKRNYEELIYCHPRYVRHHHKYGTLIAPSIRHIPPVAQGFSSIPFATSPNSLGSPNLLRGICLIIDSIAHFGMPSPIGVLNGPGAITMTLILYLPRSLAMGMTIPLMAPLVAAQTTCPLCTSPSPAMLPTMMMAPLSPSTSGCSDIIFAAYLATLNEPTTLILRALSIVPVDATPFLEISISGVKTPALFMTALTFPYVFFVNSYIALTLSSSVTSTLKKDPFTSSAIFSPKAELISAMTILAPKEARRRTAPSPRPDDPPLTITTQSLSIFIGLIYLTTYLTTVLNQQSFKI